VLWLVPGLALTKYRCEFVNLNCIFTFSHYISVKWEHSAVCRMWRPRATEPTTWRDVEELVWWCDLLYHTQGDHKIQSSARDVAGAK